MKGKSGNAGADTVSNGQIPAENTLDAQKALFGGKKPWNSRAGAEIEDEYVRALTEAKSSRDGYLFELLVYVSELQSRTQGLADRVAGYEADLKCSGRFTVRWEGWNGAPHSAVYLVEITTGESQQKHVRGNLVSSEDARNFLRHALGRNTAIAYCRCLDEYIQIKTAVTRQMSHIKHHFEFRSDRRFHPIAQWVQSVGPFWEALTSLTKQNIDRYLELDAKALDLAFAFNAERQPIRWRSVICRPELKRADPLGPGFPGFRVVTNNDRYTGKRQTVGVAAYKAKLAERGTARELEKLLGRTVTLAEVKLARSKMRKRAFSPWLTKDLIAHCKLGRHTKQINSRQRQLKKLAGEWHELRERLAALQI